MKNLNLSQFTGTEKYHKSHPGLYITDGAKYLADEAGAYWLMDIIWSYQPQINDDFQVWILKVNDDSTGVVTCIPDTDQEPYVTQDIQMTDFKTNTGLSEIKLFASKIEGATVVMLPSEY